MAHTTSSYDPHRRFGNRVPLDQPAVLEIGAHRIEGVIRNVGLGGVFFSAKDSASTTGERGTLTRHGGREVDVHVVWRGAEGLGLAFASCC